jgi:DNA-binding response OmpR family regulator
VPIIMLTAMTERRFLHGAYANGADDYITKPFDFDEIRATLSKERWQRRGASPQGEICQLRLIGGGKGS